MQKKTHRLQILQFIYDETDGQTGLYCPTHDLVSDLGKLGITQPDAYNAIEYMIAEGLLDRVSQDSVGISHAGIQEVEQVHDNPDTDTQHFPTAVIHQVQHFHGTVGGVQTGSGNTMNVAQQINAPAEILGHFNALRAEAQKLPEDKRGTAIEMVDGLEEEAKLDKPRKGRVESYSKTLVPLLITMGPIIKMIVDWIAAKHW